jgi:hypothetical protein
MFGNRTGWRTSTGLIVFLLIPALNWLWVRKLAPDMAPVRPGTAATFWAAACPLQPPKHFPGRSAIGLHQGMYIYESSHFHGSDLYGVPEDEIASLFDSAIKDIKEASERKEWRPDHEKGFQKWLANGGDVRRDIPGLLQAIEQVRSARWEKEAPEMVQWHIAANDYREGVLQRADHYWATQLFECILLSSLAWLLLWPLFFRCRWWLWAILYGLVPVLFFMPLYLGYACFTFTSRGPSGGIAYPWLVVWFAGDWTWFAWDKTLVESLPRLLDPLSTPIGIPMVLSGRGMPPPSLALRWGLALAGAVSACSFLRFSWLHKIWLDYRSIDGK